MALTLMAVPIEPAPRSNSKRTMEGNVVWKFNATVPTIAMTSRGRRTSRWLRT